MKGVDQRVLVEQDVEKSGVNVVDWTRQFVMDQDCQNGTDTKAFKGRGKFRELRQLLTGIDSLEQDMADLINATKEVPGHLMYLTLHSHKATGSKSLRWRDRSGLRRHLSWDEAKQLVQDQPSDVRQWYLRVTASSLLFNERHKHLRRSILDVRNRIARTEPAIYPRAVLAQ